MFDTLNGYIHSPDPAKQAFYKQHNILAHMQHLLAGARAVGMTTFYPCGAHSDDGSDTVLRLTDTDMDLGAGGSADQPIKPRFSKSSADADIAPEVAPMAGDVVIPKRRWNAFFQTDLDLQLRVRGIETIIIAGGSTDVGIASTLFGARDLDYGIVVAKDCCYSMRGNNNEFFMQRVFPRMGRVMSNDQIIALLTA
jgi:nicotinamidase-related amidase